MHVKYMLFALLVSMIWGVNFAVMKVGLLHLDPYLFGFMRFSIVLLILLPWLKVVPGEMVKLFWLGLLMGGLQFVLVFQAMEMTNHVSAMSIVVQMNVPISLILAHFFLNERMSYWRTGGIIISFAGVVIITLEPEILEEGVVVLIVLAATTLYALGMILMRRLSKVAVFQTQAWIALYSVPVFLAMTLIFEENQIPQMMTMDMVVISAVLYTSILSTIVGYGGINFLLRRFPVTLISPFMVTVPVFATIASVLFLGEVLTGKFILGSLVTISGLGIIHLRDWQLKRKARDLLP